ncbi:glycosyltransferase family 2 protein [Neobacillus sp. NPDC058068]|uniref:glycosyltransferase family 2 protein n=1 Tax=Neobacillus sp. NPDC058068 TaxID=3346325 RepID=UPI0036DBB605
MSWLLNMAAKLLTHRKDGPTMMFVSMVMAVHNGERFLKEALDHALAQTYPHLEIIIVNDGSTDSTPLILDELNDPRARVIHLEKNQGAAHALNVGINNAQGDWIAIQDADDNSYPARIEEQVNYLQQHPSLVGVGTLIHCISGDVDVPDEAYEGVKNFKNSNITRRQIRKMIYWGCPLTHSSVMFSKRVFREVGGYEPKFKIAYDYDLWLKLLEKGDMEVVPKILLDYRIHQSSLSNKNEVRTIDEVQMASSTAIYRALVQGKQHEPKVIIIGPEKGCGNYIAKIAPKSGLKVVNMIYKNRSKQVSEAIRKLKKEKADAIIVLDDDEKQTILRKLAESRLILNKDVYVLINILK